MFYAAFIPETKDCSYKKCYFGYIANYSSSSGDFREGYPNTDGIQPTFRFNANNAADTKVTFAEELDDDWVNLIEIACEKMNPFNPVKHKKDRLETIDGDNNLMDPSA